MVKGQLDLEGIVDRLGIDDKPNPAHREKLRRQMLLVFSESASRYAGRAGGRSRTITERPLLKFAAAAVVVAAAAIGAYRIVKIIKPDHPRSNLTAKQPEEPNIHRPVYTGTPGFVEMVPIDIKLPEAVFAGPPLPKYFVPNLDRAPSRPRPPFLAPAGTKNVALGKPVTSSSDEEPVIGELEMITDGDKEATDASYVELGPSTQHITIDLEAPHYIYAIVVWHYHREPRVYYDVVVQVADDANFTTNVRTLFNNDIDNSSGLGVGKDKHYIETNEGKLIDARGVKARYVRLYSRGNTSNGVNHYIEVEVYGKPAE